MSDIQRLIDANANRAREAIRVMEDAARFLLNDSVLSEALKQLRHELAAALSGSNGLVLSRDTPADVGTSITTESENRREDQRAVVVSAGKRLSEALRVIEEFSKIETSSNIRSQTIEKIRYRGYELERRLVSAIGSTRRRQWQVCILITESLCVHHTWQQVVEEIVMLPNTGSRLCIQLREKTLDDSDFLERARWLVDRCRSSGIDCIINDRPDIAILSKADGVHLGQTDMPVAEARRILGFGAVIGVSTSRLAEAEQVLRDGGDYCGVGPMFETTTKHKPVLAGPQYLQKYLTWNKLPHLAIGGINPGNVSTLRDVGVQGVAVSCCVCAAKSPGAVVKDLLEALN